MSHLDCIYCAIVSPRDELLLLNTINKLKLKELNEMHIFVKIWKGKKTTYWVSLYDSNTKKIINEPLDDNSWTHELFAYKKKSKKINKKETISSIAIKRAELDENPAITDTVLKELLSVIQTGPDGKPVINRRDDPEINEEDDVEAKYEASLKSSAKRYNQSNSRSVSTLNPIVYDDSDDSEYNPTPQRNITQYDPDEDNFSSHIKRTLDEGDD